MGIDTGADPSTIDDGYVIDDMEIDAMSADVQQRRDAFLFMIRCCEHSAADVAEGVDYQTFYGGARFWDLSDHPVITGEMQGVPLPAQMCINAGFKSGVCVSTAAGAYQFTRPTWVSVRAQGARLPDFTPESQDAGALRLLEQIGALAAIDRGDVRGAIALAGKRWASLPGAIGKQGQRSYDFALSKFNEGLQA